MKGLKSQLKNEKEGSDISAESSKKMRQITVFAGDSFVSAVELAAKKMGLSKSNFVRLAVAKAVREAGVEIDDSEAVSYRGKQSAPKNEVLSAAAGARAVRMSKRPGTPENARRLELLALGYDEEAIGAYLYAKARAEKTVGRPLTPEEDEEFITSAAARIAEINQCNGGWGEGPPNM